MNLELEILCQVISGQVEYSGNRGVALSPIRKHHSIPSSTFYRAVKKLRNYNLITLVMRDKYSISDNLALSIEEISKGKS